MKKVIWAVTLAGLILLSAGCSLIDKTAISSYEEAASADTQVVSSPDDVTASAAPESSNNPAANGITAPSADAEEETPSPSDPTAPENGEPDYPALGEALLKSESIGSIKINMTETELTGLLGEPKDISMPDVWGADGLAHSDWSYEDQGLVINMAEDPESGAYIVYSIKAMAPCTMKTSRGIAVGDTKDSVLAAYAEEYNTGESDEYGLVFGSVYGGMLVTIDDGRILEIFIGAAAE
jgi:hypothetical protein